MMVVRIVHFDDLDALMRLATQTGPGLTSLKPDREALAHRIDRVSRTLAGTAARAEQGYLFVMEDTATREVVGVCGLEAAVGLDEPFYNYRVSTVVNASRGLGVRTHTQLLTVCNDLTGYAELRSLFLTPASRSGGHGALLSKSRFMFLAQFQDRFPERICAELRGSFDARGESPFWNAVGSHFYQIDFNQADYMTSHGQRTFLAELMPRLPVYVALLPPDAQASIGATHHDTVPARRLLESEGMRFQNLVDIFDAGPVLESHVDTTRAVTASALPVVGLEAGPRRPVTGRNAPRTLVSNQSLENFRTVLVPAAPRAGTLVLLPEEADTLGVASGERVRTLPLYPRRATAPAAPSPQQDTP